MRIYPEVPRQNVVMFGEVFQDLLSHFGMRFYADQLRPEPVDVEHTPREIPSRGA